MSQPVEVGKADLDMASEAGLPFIPPKVAQEGQNGQLPGNKLTRIFNIVGALVQMLTYGLASC